jgi:hypothetical protein
MSSTDLDDAAGQGSARATQHLPIMALGRPLPSRRPLAGRPLAGLDRSAGKRPRESCRLRGECRPCPTKGNAGQRREGRAEKLKLCARATCIPSRRDTIPSMEGFNTEQVKQLREIVSDIVLPLHETLSARIDTLDAHMERGFAAVAEDIADLRTEFIEFRTETHENFASLRAEIRDIRHRLEALEEAVHNSVGLTKEIDYLMERVVDIEKHLGIKHKIAA